MSHLEGQGHIYVRASFPSCQPYHLLMITRCAREASFLSVYEPNLCCPCLLSSLKSAGLRICPAFSVGVDGRVTPCISFDLVSGMLPAASAAETTAALSMSDADCSFALPDGGLGVARIPSTDSREAVLPPSRSAPSKSTTQMNRQCDGSLTSNELLTASFGPRGSSRLVTFAGCDQVRATRFEEASRLDRWIYPLGFIMHGCFGLGVQVLWVYYIRIHESPSCDEVKLEGGHPHK